jgi:PAT family beta-lactamase induction signal transducer AmpG
MNKRLLIVFGLGFSSGLPFALITGTLQAWFAHAGMSVMATGLLSLVGLPYALRMIWAPVIDRFPILSIGLRRGWILLMQALLLLGFYALSSMSPVTRPEMMAVLALILSFFSATQDLAIDAYRIELLQTTEYGFGASLTVFGYRLAMLLAGGFSLIIAQYAGWEVTYRVMGALMLFGMLVAVFMPESLDQPIHASQSPYSLMMPFHELLSRSKIIPLLLFIFFYKLGGALTTTTSGVMMPFLVQQLGFSLDAIAYVNKIIGIAAILSGGLLAGFLLHRWPLYRALLIFGVFQALSNIMFIILSLVGKDLPTFVVAVVMDNMASGMTSTALVVLLMRLVDRRFTATQFSILVALSTIPAIVSGPLGACLQYYWGWTGLYGCSFFLALFFIPFLICIRSLLQIDLVQICPENKATSMINSNQSPRSSESAHQESLCHID